MLDEEAMPIMCATTLLCEGFEAKCRRLEGHSGHHVAVVFGRNFEWLWYGDVPDLIDGSM